jgi:hypothetical protein
MWGVIPRLAQRAEGSRKRETASAKGKGFSVGVAVSNCLGEANCNWEVPRRLRGSG